MRLRERPAKDAAASQPASQPLSAAPPPPKPPPKPPPAPSAGRASLLLGRVPSSRSRVGHRYQATLPPPHVPSVLPPPAAAPSCRCGEPAVWLRARWWCAREESEGGCGYEVTPPADQPLTPLCGCGVPSLWQRGFWWCAAAPRAAGCDFMVRGEARADALQSSAHVEAEMARATAALLRASALGPLEDFTFVGETGDCCGKGLFARQDLPADVVLSEYGGPRLHVEQLKRGEYALQSTPPR